ncbi:MAG: peptidoglycan DD-metalloendopeptidase family protein [Chloroflexi bacterium]|nr:peptidoglycan DD-metalloendopeptidase family protein [Chloroflexota bacterium]
MATPAQPLGLRPGPRNQVVPLFEKPFAGEFALGNFFDHELPFEFKDDNGFQLTWWGTRTGDLDGHNGYDWLLPDGTPLLATADGEVVFAGTFPNFDCPPLKRAVDEQLVEVLHDAHNGERFSSSYSHLSRIDVQVGQRVRTGQVIGLSGQTGCSEVPHLHFAARRWVNTNNGRTTWVDPYGWEGDQPDPWGQHPEGAASVWLWKQGQAPQVFRELRASPNPGPDDAAPVAIALLRWMGWKDAENPNNEFAQLEVDPRFAPSGSSDLTGFGLRNNRGDTFLFPRGFTVRRDRPVKVHSGTGRNTDTDLYWGRPSGVWDDLGDCAYLVHPGDSDYPVWYRFWYLKASCKTSP